MPCVFSHLFRGTTTRGHTIFQRYGSNRFRVVSIGRARRRRFVPPWGLSAEKTRNHLLRINNLFFRSIRLVSSGLIEQHNGHVLARAPTSKRIYTSLSVVCCSTPDTAVLHAVCYFSYFSRDLRPRPRHLLYAIRYRRLPHCQRQSCPAATLCAALGFCGGLTVKLSVADTQVYCILFDLFRPVYNRIKRRS